MCACDVCMFLSNTSKLRFSLCGAEAWLLTSIHSRVARECESCLCEMFACFVFLCLFLPVKLQFPLCGAGAWLFAFVHPCESWCLMRCFLCCCVILKHHCTHLCYLLFEWIFVSRYSMHLCFCFAKVIISWWKMITSVCLKCSHPPIHAHFNNSVWASMSELALFAYRFSNHFPHRCFHNPTAHCLPLTSTIQRRKALNQSHITI